MGVAVIFVIVLACAASWLVYNLILVPLQIEYLYNIAFILVIASLVQFVEMFLKKSAPALYQALGVFLPLITTNCAVLGVAVLNMQREYSFIESIFNGIGGAAGFALAIVLFAADTNTLVERVSKITGFEERNKISIMAKIVHSIQQHCRMNMIDDGCCGVRELISWVQSYMICGDMMEAAKYTILPSVSADEENREEIITTCLDPVLNP